MKASRAVGGALAGLLLGGIIRAAVDARCHCADQPPTAALLSAPVAAVALGIAAARTAPTQCTIVYLR